MVITAKCEMANFTVAMECEEDCNLKSIDVQEGVAQSSGLREGKGGLTDPAGGSLTNG